MSKFASEPRLDLGSGVVVRLQKCAHSDDFTHALVEYHDVENPDPDDSPCCVGGVSWCPECEGPTWELHSLDPLHIEPSVRTSSRRFNVTGKGPHEHHGFIREGRWVPA